MHTTPYARRLRGQRSDASGRAAEGRAADALVRDGWDGAGAAPAHGSR